MTELTPIYTMNNETESRTVFHTNLRTSDDSHQANIVYLPIM